MLPLMLQSITYLVDGRKIIDSISAEVRDGTRTIILGPNGAGKSTLLKLCHGLITPTSGSIRWNAAIGATPRQAMVFQRPVMLRRTALRNLTYALAVNGVARSQRKARAAQALALVGLQMVADRPARVLSGGEQQRLALARAWALAPEVLFLDEPTANLDPGATREIESIIENIHLGGTKIIMTTHSLAQATRLGDDIVFLAGGRLLEHAPVQTFFRAPNSAEAAVFIKGELPWQ